MAVTEMLMKAGSWELSLVPGTPRQIVNGLSPFGHVMITGSVIDPRTAADSDLKRMARYVGIVRDRPTASKLAGPGLIAWLGDEEGKGDQFEANLVLTAQTFVQSVTAALPLHGSIIAGTLTAMPGGPLTQSFFIANGMGTSRSILDWIMTWWTGLGGGGAEYRVNNDATLDAGPTATLFPTTPKAIFVPWLPSVDPNIVGIQASDDDVAIDADSYSTRIFYVGASSSNAQANAPATSYKDLRGNTAWLTRLVVNTNTAAGNVAGQAAGQALLYPLRQQVKLTSSRYDLRRDVGAGDWIYVYDPEKGMTDQTNQVLYGGQAVLPLKQRVLSMTWPIEAGMGVYYRDSTGVYTDLTQYVAWESPGATFEIGAQNRALTF